MNIQKYLYPDDLDTSASSLDKILFIGSCNSRDFATSLSVLNRHLSIDYLYYGIGTELPENPNAKEYQLHYIQLPLREIIGDSIISSYSNKFIDYSETFLDALARLEFSLEKCLRYNKELGILTIVSNFIIPQSINAQSLSGINTNNDICNLVSNLNKSLSNIISKYRNVYIGDTESAAASYGKHKFLDDIFYFTTHGTVASSTHGLVASGDDWSFHENSPSWSNGISGRIEPIPRLTETYDLDGNQFYQLIYSQLNWIYRIVNQIDSIKLVIFDLDNTLWRGQIGEHYDDGKEWPDSHGWPVGIWEAIQILRRRGILVSISSKNDESLVRSRWERAVNLNWIKFDDFLSPRINWYSKAENIKNLLNDLSLTPKNVLFVDDNPVEREEVKTSIPGIRVVGSNPYLTRRILLWSAETNRAFLSEESIGRESTYQGVIERSNLEKSLNRDDFLKNMQVSVLVNNIKSTNDDEYPRVVELLNKTNQFNTTAMKWTNQNLGLELINGMKIVYAKVSDKFSNYGLTAVLLIKNNVIQQFVMSCRILGLDVDRAILFASINQSLSNNETILGPVIKTEINNPCHNVYTNSGFIKTDIEGVYMRNSPLNLSTFVSLTNNIS